MSTPVLLILDPHLHHNKTMPGTLLGQWFIWEGAPLDLEKRHVISLKVSAILVVQPIRNPYSDCLGPDAP